MAMFPQLNDAGAKAACGAAMAESRRNLVFLEDQLKEALAQAGINEADNASNAPQLPLASGSILDRLSHSDLPIAAEPPTTSSQQTPARTDSFDHVRFDKQLTLDKVKYRLTEISHRLATEQRVKEGAKNMLNARRNLTTTSTSRGSIDNNSITEELKIKMEESNRKVAVLEKAKLRYAHLAPSSSSSSLDGSSDSVSAEDSITLERKQRRSGRLRIKIIRATNLSFRLATQYETTAHIFVDSNSKLATKPSVQGTYNDILDTHVDRAQEVEINIYSHPGGTLLGLVWFKLADLEQDIAKRYPNGLPASVDDAEDTWLDLEPTGHLLLRITFEVTEHSTIQPNNYSNQHRPSLVAITDNSAAASSTPQKVRRNKAVQKAFPKNGHLFYPIYSLFNQCAVCNESGTKWYQCAACNYTCHDHCYSNVITKCITPSDTSSNSGQLLKYNIPHRWVPKTVLNSWCAHCGSMMGPTSRTEQCVDCGKCAHVGCAPMVPNFCNLTPEMAKLLVAAFEEAEKREQAEEMKEAEVAEVLRREKTLLARRSVNAPPAVAEITKDAEEIVLLGEREFEVDADAPPVPALPPSTASSSTGQAFMDAERKAKIDKERLELIQKRKEERDRQKAELERLRKLQEEEDRREAERLHAIELEKLRELQEQQRLQQQQQAEKLRQLKLKQQQQATPPGSPKAIKLEDFNCIAVLGRGAFGKVMLVEDRRTRKLHAMKALKKKDLIESGDIDGVKLEKAVFQRVSEAQHPFLVNMYSCFQSASRLYFVMEYVCGGDLMSAFHRKEFTYEQSRFYACEVLLAIEFLHQNDIVYRDLKLENILMCPDGHIKVCDYGICKQNMPYGAQTRTFCGTPNYMAPEVLQHANYTRIVDWWSFGVIVYIMHYRSFPFKGDEAREVLKSIMANRIKYPPLDSEAVSLLQGLLNKYPKSRLGGGRLGSEEIKQHPYFDGIDWNAMMQKKVTPPWKPTLKNERDVSNFEEEFTGEKPVLTVMHGKLSPTEQVLFDNFEFISELAMAAAATGATMARR
ncbi:Serine/threonine kinase [Rhizoclosmatium sp. JEL0117]|nr:Serine/threonine kinase [Rhizoclosmatium sp. JEL0117]